MAGIDRHDHDASDIPDLDDADNDVDTDAVKQHKIRYNPSARTKLDSAEGTRIRYNPSRSSDDGV